MEDLVEMLTGAVVGNYTPPACMGNSNTVMMNFSVTSKGTQYDRLAIM